MRSNDEIIKLLTTLKNERNLSLSELARRVGMAKSALSRYFNKTRQFPLNKANDFAKALDVTPEYILGLDYQNDKISTLITKTGEIMKQLKETNQKDVYDFANQKLKEQNTEKTPPDNVVEFKGKEDMNQYPVDLNGKLSAGHGFMNTDKNNPIRTIYLDHVPNRYDLAFEIDGNSMYPTFEDGEIVFIQKTQDIHNGMLAAIEINNEAFIKKIYFDSNRLRLVSLNIDKNEKGERLYPDFYADEFDNIHMIGRVIN